MASLKPSALRQKLSLSKTSRSPGHTTPNEASDAESIASGVSGLSHESAADPNDEADVVSRKYVLRVTAGPSYDSSTHKAVKVNSEEACEIENEFVKAHIRARIKRYRGLPKGSAEFSDYFATQQHKNDRYSVEFSFIPKRDLAAKDVIWGNDFDTPVRDRLPPAALFNTAFSIVKRFVDPGLSCDVYTDKPWMYGPALSTWSVFHIGEQYSQSEYSRALEASSKSFVEEGAEGTGAEIRDEEDMPSNPDKRRKHYLNESNREDFDFEEGRLYRGDFFGPYIDFNKLALKLPGFSLSVLKYMNDKSHIFRYVCKNVKTNQVYFVVCITLLFGDDIAAAEAADADAESAPLSDESSRAQNQHGNGNRNGAEYHFVDEDVD